MLAYYIAQFLLELIRAFFIDELSERVRDRARMITDTRRERRKRRSHSKKALRIIRTLSTDRQVKVQ